MIDIFISYSSKDREWVKAFAEVLTAQGYEVWWDTGLLAGHDFQTIIPEKLAAARCVIVVWSEHSVASIWVRAEASRGLTRKILVPLQLRDAEIPMPFDIIHTEDFRQWSGVANDLAFKRLLLAVAQHTEPSLLLKQAEEEQVARAAEAQAALVREQEQEALKAQAQEFFLATKRAEEERERQVKAEAQAQLDLARKEQERVDAEKRAKAQQAKPAILQPVMQAEVVTPPKRQLGLSKAVLVGLGVLVVLGGGGWWLKTQGERQPEPAPEVSLKPATTEPNQTTETPTSGYSSAKPSTTQASPASRLPYEPEMVPIPAGSFEMGCSNGKDCNDDETPVRTVKVSAFEMSKTEVTFAQWDACVAEGGCGGYKPDDEKWGRDDRPVINVSWDDAQSYVTWLSQKTRKKYRLPTESEWEYAARAGTTTSYFWDDEIGQNRANCDGCGSEWDNKQTAPVGRFAANAWGLQDMQGNVWEWVHDCYHEDYKGAPADAREWAGDCEKIPGQTIIYRVLRGGSWFYGPLNLRSAGRYTGDPTQRSDIVGFRISRNF